jgi:hypothetical protein
MREFEAVHYECKGFQICRAIYEDSLNPQLRILYSMVVTRTTYQTLEIANLKTCGRCQKPIIFVLRKVIMISESGGLTNLGLANSACNIVFSFPPSVNYANSAMLRNSHNLLYSEARNFLHISLTTLFNKPIPFELNFLIKNICRNEFFSNTVEVPRVSSSNGNNETQSENQPLAVISPQQVPTPKQSPAKQ